MPEKFYPPLSFIAGRYEVASRPLLGGMGIVYLCYDHAEDRPVALKTFKSEYLPDRTARDRFLREGTTWVDLGRHPNIVSSYEVVRVGDGREIYMALELIAKAEGRDDASLRAWLTPDRPLPVEQALLFALQIVRGMQHASAQIPGFVHRDLKPENVLVGADRLTSLRTNRLRVTDFGLANILSGSGVTSLEGSELPEASQAGSGSGSRPLFSRTQLTHGIVGTPLYMAPEQWTGGPLGIHTDVYALGSILFEMLAGQRAVKGHTLQALQQAHCQGKIGALPNTLPATVRNLVTRCLHVAPEGRYPAWGTLETALTETWQQVTGQALLSAEAPQELGREARVAAGWSYNNLGLSYLDLGKADVARDYFARAKAMGQAEGARALEGAALGNLGTAYANLGDAQQAIELHEQQLAISRESGDRQGEGAALGNLGLSYKNMGDARRAIGLHEQQLAISRENGDRQGEGVALNNLGLAYADLGDARQALGFYEQALVISRESGDRHREGATLGNLGTAYARLGDAQRAIEFHEQALVISRAIGDRRGEGADLGNLGNAYRDLGDARRAIEFFAQYLAISREIGDRSGEGAAMGNLGNAYRNLGDAQQAIGFFEQVLVIFRAIGDRRGEGQTLGNLGNAYADLGDARRAIGFYEQDLAISRAICDRLGEGRALGNLGIAYLETGDAWRAIEYLRKALAIHHEMGDVLTAAMSRANLGLSLAHVGQAQEAISLVKQAIYDYQHAGYVQQAQQAEQMLAQLQGGGTPVQTNPTQAAFVAFQQAGSAQEMQAAVAQYPFMTDAQFIVAVEQIITQQVPPEHQPAFLQSLAWLRQIAGQE